MFSFSRLAQGSIAIVGCLGIAALTASGARAENASVTGAVTYTTPGSYSLSISAQKVAPAGYSFKGALEVVAVGTAGAAPTGVTLNDGGLEAPVGTPTQAASIRSSVIAKLGTITGNAPADLDAYAAILKAAAGADGLE
jgi:hypothetical protein